MNPQEKKITVVFPNYLDCNGLAITQKWSPSTLRLLPYYERLLDNLQWEDPDNPVIENEDNPQRFLELVDQVLAAPYGGSISLHMADFYGLDIVCEEPEIEPVIHKELIEIRAGDKSNDCCHYLLNFRDLRVTPKEFKSVELYPSENKPIIGRLILGNKHIWIESAGLNPLRIENLINASIFNLGPPGIRQYYIQFSTYFRHAQTINVCLEYLA